MSTSSASVGRRSDFLSRDHSSLSIDHSVTHCDPGTIARVEAVDGTSQAHNNMRVYSHALEV